VGGGGGERKGEKGREKKEARDIRHHCLYTSMYLLRKVIEFHKRDYIYRIERERERERENLY
jgi:hypothetical protein